MRRGEFTLGSQGGEELKSLRDIRQLIVKVRKLDEILATKTIDIEGVTLNIPTDTLVQIESKKKELLAEIYQAIEGNEEVQ